MVIFNDGYINSDGKPSYFYARCVRLGP